MQITKSLRAVAFAAGILGFAISAHADINGSEWMVPDGTGQCAQDAVIGCIPGSAANLTFTVSNNGLNFTSDANYNLGDFIASGGTLTGTPSYNIATSATKMDAFDSSTNYGACHGGQTCGSIFEFTGTAFFTNGEKFTVNSDDGVTLYVGGTASGNIVLSSPGPQSLSTTNGTYTGATGSQSFTFVYAECCGAPAVFNTNLQAGGNVPEPASITLFGSLLLGLGLTLRRKLKA